MEYCSTTMDWYDELLRFAGSCYVIEVLCCIGVVCFANYFSKEKKWKLPCVCDVLFYGYTLIC
jgi:hypothetical protein